MIFADMDYTSIDDVSVKQVLRDGRRIQQIKYDAAIICSTLAQPYNQQEEIDNNIGRLARMVGELQDYARRYKSHTDDPLSVLREVQQLVKSNVNPAEYMQIFGKANNL